MFGFNVNEKDMNEVMVYLYHPKLLYIFKKFEERLNELLYPKLSEIGKKLYNGLKTVEKGLTIQGFNDKCISLGFSTPVTEDFVKVFTFVDQCSIDDLNAVHERVKKYILREIIKKEVNSYNAEDNPEKFIETLSGLTLSNLSNNFLDDKAYTIAGFDELDPQAMKDELQNRIIKSSVELINKSTPLGGYLRKQMFCISAAPGSGKSLLCMQECVEFAKQGLHVLYSAFGDLKQYDFLTRMTAQVNHQPFAHVEMNLVDSFKLALKNCPQLANIAIETYLPDKFTASEYVNHVLTDEYKDTGLSLHEWADVIVIDYDANIRSEQTMYLKGEEIYQTLYRLTEPDKLVLMVSQLSKYAWAKEVIDLSDLGESSRKQQIIDGMLTLSHPPSNNPRNHVGYMNLCKGRRISLMKSPYFRDLDGNFYGLKSDHYSLIKAASDTKTFIQAIEPYMDLIAGDVSVMAPPKKEDITFSASGEAQAEPEKPKRKPKKESEDKPSEESKEKKNGDSADATFDGFNI